MLCAGQIVLPPTPLGQPGVRGKICVIKKGGALENEVTKVIKVHRKLQEDWGNRRSDVYRVFYKEELANSFICNF